MNGRKQVLERGKSMCEGPKASKNFMCSSDIWGRDTHVGAEQTWCQVRLGE